MTKIIYSGKVIPMRALLFFIFLLGPMSIFAQNEGALISALAEIDYPPYYYINPKTKKLEGFSIEVCNHLAQKLGYKLNHVRRPFARALHDLAYGRIDLMCTLFNTKDRSKGILFSSVPHVFEDIMIFTLKDPQRELSDPSPDHFHNLEIGGIKGYYYGPEVSETDDYKLLLVTDEEQLMKVLIKKRVHYIIGNKDALLKKAQEMNVEDQIKYLETPIYTGPLFIGFSRQNKNAFKRLSEFTDELIQFRQTQKYQKLLKKYKVREPRF